MTRQEVRFLIARLEDPWKLAAQLMYGSGLRILETLRLRVKDLDFGQGTITIRAAQSLLGHSSVESTMTYLVMIRQGTAATSPLDLD